MNRTTMAAVYPEQLCRALMRDVKKFLSYKNTVEDYYKCQRCSMGRAATADMEHSFLPGECRYGKWPEGEGPRERKRLEREQQDQDNIFENFRKEALRNPKVMQGKLAAHPSISFDSEQTAILKMCIINLLSSAVDKFDKTEKKKDDQSYVHWLEDPTSLGWLQRILKDYMRVQGAMACLQPWSTPTPEPQLSVDEAPLRLLLRGSIESWKIGQVEDLRTLSLSQWHEPIELDEDWLIAFFGADPEGEPTTSSSASSIKAIKDKDADDDPGGELALLPQPELEEEAAEEPAHHPGSLRPIFDFRRVFARLPRLAGTDDITAKRLILGLHERLWHAGTQEVKNILIRCGMPHAVWRLTGDAVSSCRICRKFSRAGRRPQFKGANLSMQFNEMVQADLYNYDGETFLLVIDEATRYKVATKCESRELKHILGALMRCWIRYFGPMRTLVSDQETALMTVHAGVELQRLGIARQPGGTTSKLQGQQHTATGLVEKHIDLTKLTMAKIQAEAARWGLEIEGEELACEACMAANTIFNVGGYSPVTMLFGVLPRGYLEPEEPLQGDEVSPDESAFERSLRLRQVALQASQAAILETRISRANRSRPQRLPVEEMIPGTTKVELFRDDGGGYGWRGPATVLQINEAAGTAIVEFQQRPYLVGLRHLRPLRESYLQFLNEASTTTSKEAEQALLRMKMIVEDCTPYKPNTMGEILKIENGENKMLRFPKEDSDTVNQMLKDATTFLDFHYKHVAFHGVCFGKGMKTILVPKFSKGTLITWSEGIVGIAVTEHNVDSNIHIKELFVKNIDKLCHLYLYGYVQYQNED